MTTTPTASPELPDLDKLEALARAATPGRWMRLFGERTVYDRMEDGCRGNAIVRADLGYGLQDISNLDFIAAANPAAVLELIALARRAALANQPAPTVPAGTYQVERNRCDCHPETCCCDGWAIVRVAGDQRTKHSTHAARPVADEIARALAHQPAQEQAEPTTPETDGQDRRALELANAALIASEPKFPEGWDRHERAIHLTSCALHKPAAQQEPVAAPHQTAAHQEKVRPAGYLTPSQFERLALGQVAEILPVESGSRGKTAVYFSAQLDGGQEGSGS